MRGIVELTAEAERLGKAPGRFRMEWGDGMETGVFWCPLTALGNLPDLNRSIRLGGVCAEAMANLHLLPDGAVQAAAAPLNPEPTMPPDPGSKNRRRGPVVSEED